MSGKVMIGCPVRNRAWAMPEYLGHIMNLDYALTDLEFCFIINDCVDNTGVILRDFAIQNAGRVRLVERNHKQPGHHLRGRYSLSRLADLRNLLLREFLASSCSHLFSVDSDILVPPHSLKVLLQDRCDIVSALVCNGHEIGDNGLFNILGMDSYTGAYLHIRDFPKNQLFPVECTGAAYLIDRGVIEDAGVRYSAFRGSEDIGFCEDARRKGRGIFCDSRVKCVHLMKEGEFTKREIKY